MSHHTIHLEWTLDTGDFLARRYSREHTWTFDGGLTISASSSPVVVPIPYSNPACIDPEEAFIAAISSCHMLWYLSFAAERGLIIARYRDQATGTLTRETSGKAWISAVTLEPHVTYRGTTLPSAEEEAAIHHAAHEACFIANSVQTVITVQNRLSSLE